MKTKRVVIKIGSSSLTNIHGQLDSEKLEDHVAAIARLASSGYQIVLVSSGAIAAGYSGLGYPARPVTIAGKQAAAAVGQVMLLNHYTRAFHKYGITIAQLLLARQDFERREQMSHAYSALSELLKRSVIPIINENDSVSLEELTFGDNDMLSALVSGLIHADFLAILTDVNGLYDKNPNEYDDAVRYHYLDQLPDHLLNETSAASGSKVGTGGMKSKLSAARTALSLGVRTFIGTGKGTGKLVAIIKGEGDGTYIGSRELKPSLKVSKQWIALHSPVSGKIEIDDGAVRALMEKGKSLLPAGIRKINGHFHAGEVIQIVDRKNHVLGKGQVNYSSEQLEEIKRMNSTHAMDLIDGGHAEVVHRDNWVPWTATLRPEKKKGARTNGLSKEK
ncbi:glutamate 5-kinase [Sporolactobacillus terrae]|uniref:Glutamate 5-kinase n=1 Tax=Sporolactobacillus terrae TaxID=269673 RepID=A0A410D9E4_9BACL|nr:glutamate 5-kinase [Sporolactobacillus terrae]QAA22705.1 glutamate 5-kinase [Sporolactobacillus terrae]QAA25678.1 glutamate 5-kinase [Sporolactobacillus terrae]UAK17490.1 glutamate 5-kinase [Sporolactobacillus terrae]BBN99036.1 glutamate 5-kinase [Sporolactobacillus terrae]